MISLELSSRLKRIGFFNLDVIAANYYLEDTRLHLQIDRWESKDNNPVELKDFPSASFLWKHLSEIQQKEYIDWVFFLVHSGRL